MRCPKCKSTNVNIEKPRSSGWGTQTGEDQALHCYTCGNMIYGLEKIKTFFDAQKAAWEEFQIQEEKRKAELPPPKLVVYPPRPVLLKTPTLSVAPQKVGEVREVAPKVEEAVQFDPCPPTPAPVLNSAGRKMGRPRKPVPVTGQLPPATRAPERGSSVSREGEGLSLKERRTIQARRYRERLKSGLINTPTSCALVGCGKLVKSPLKYCSKECAKAQESLRGKLYREKMAEKNKAV